MRNLLNALTDESHIVRGGERGVHLTAFGWAVVAILGTAFGLIGAALAIWSMK